MKNSLVFRFWDKFEKPEVGCWNWLGAEDGHGYGMIRHGGYGRKGSHTMQAK